MLKKYVYWILIVDLLRLESNAEEDTETTRNAQISRNGAWIIHSVQKRDYVKVRCVGKSSTFASEAIFRSLGKFICLFFYSENPMIYVFVFSLHANSM